MTGNAKNQLCRYKIFAGHRVSEIFRVSLHGSVIDRGVSSGLVLYIHLIVIKPLKLRPSGFICIRLQIQSAPAYIITSSCAFPQVLEILQLFLACLLRITLYSAWSYCCKETSVSVVYIITTIITDKLARKRRFPKSALAVIVKSETSSH